MPFGLTFTLENLKGSYKSFGDNPEYPLKGVTYPVDYGYVEGYKGEDGDELDMFFGSGEKCGYIKVWRLDVPEETKFFVQLTEEELEKVLNEFKPVLVISQELDQQTLWGELQKFKL